MTDLKILKELEKQLHVNIYRCTINEFIEGVNNEALQYIRGRDNLVIGLKIRYQSFKTIPTLILMLQNLEYLDLSNNEIVAIPDLTTLSKLIYIKLSQNKITNIFRLSSLKQVTSLMLNGNKIKDISHLKPLQQLNRLELYGNQIEDISAIQSLKNIEELNIGGNRINNISVLTALRRISILRVHNNKISNISPLRGLQQLAVLILSENKIGDISPLKDLKQNTQLSLLYLAKNNLSDISPIASLTQIKELGLENNNLVDISSLQHLTQISELYLDNNQIIDISPLQKLTGINKLTLRHNKIEDISPLRHMQSLKTLSLCHNPIKKLPIWIAELGQEVEWKDSYEEKIYFFDNPIETPPIEIIQQGNQAIKDWFAANRKKLNEIKILLVGDAKAGKTSIIQKLKYNKFEAEQKQTDGIVIEDFKFNELPTFENQKGLHDTTGYFWDFGGQEIMSSTHQFFMTKRSIYVLVLEARKDVETDKQVRQWMERIQAFGGDSDVIIVGNKIDLNPAFGIDTTALQRDFSQIKAYLNVSCETGENIDKLKNTLAEFIPKAELFNTEIDERWIDIKNDLQEITGREFTLSYKQFVEICRKHGLSDAENQKQAIRFLNDLGIVLHFDELHMAEYFVLDPLWVTTGVYRIVTSDTAARQKGDIAVNDLGSIVNEQAKQKQGLKHIPEKFIEYTPNECNYIADIMQQFELGYYINNHTRFLIPDLLDKETPRERSEDYFNAPEKLNFVYAYKFIPTTIMPRIMVALRDDISFAWRTGVLLECNRHFKARAMITTIDKGLQIIVLGDYKQKREYLSVIRYVIDQINASYTVEVEMKIPLPGYEKHFAKYEHLIKLEKRGDKMYENLDIDREFEISVLLDGIGTKEEVQKLGKTFIKQAKENRKRIKIFLASSKELEDERKQFEIFIYRKNKDLYSRDVFIHLDIWEDLPTAISLTRSQDDYNKEVQASDITVVLFFTKMGEYTDEEFEIALGQFKKTSKPLIYTYFKDAAITTGSADRNDMQSLWAFQDKLKAIGHFYTAYTNTDELIRKFDTELTRYIDNLL